jgi:DNA modification methylase
MGILVVQGDARQLPLPDASVDLIVTSPPYFGLRSYTDGGAHYAGQIGSEGTPAEYVAALVACTAEWVRVLKPSGSLFVNLGDKYGMSVGSNHGTGKTTLRDFGPKTGKASPAPVRPSGTPKSLLGLPWRYALACIDQLGLILRAEIIWAKPNGLPESVQDRVRRAHEQVFHFTRRPRYYSAVDEVREPQDTIGERHGSSKGYRALALGFTDQQRTLHPLGKLPGSVWSIPSQPLILPRAFAHARCCQGTDPDCKLGLDHFAAFPMELPRRLILGWSPPGVCAGCGEGRRPVTQAGYQPTQRTNNAGAIERNGDNHFSQSLRPFGRARLEATITGYACACPAPTAPTRPAVVLDPFGGTGTTALLAHTLGRTGITIDRSADYNRIAAWRCSDPGERARAMQVDKPQPVPPSQEPLFGLAEL